MNARGGAADGPPRLAAGCVIVARRTGRVLFCLRARGVPSGGVWGTWGGKTEEGETPRETALREVREETGRDLGSEVLHLHRLNSRGFVYDTFVLVVDEEFCPAIGPEADGYAWLPADRAPAPLHWGLAKLLNDPGTARRLGREIERVSGRPCRLGVGGASSPRSDKAEAKPCQKDPEGAKARRRGRGRGRARAGATPLAA